VDGLLQAHAHELEFLVLFGSRARGDWSPASDYDLLLGLAGEDGLRLLDRMAVFAPQEALDVEVFPYSRSEWQQMLRDYHPLLLEALEGGMILWDRGAFATMRECFRRWRQEGRVQPWREGWKISERIS
jgi:hypothetical protein